MILISRATNDTGSSVTCTFPRLFVGIEGFIECIEFNTSYPCPESSDRIPRSNVCDEDPCNDCLEEAEHSPRNGFKCIKNNQYCILPQMFLYDDVPDCQNGEDLCFVEGR